MTSRVRLLLVLTFASCCGAVLIWLGTTVIELAIQNMPTDAGDQPGSAPLTFDVVVENVDLAANTITAQGYRHVIPPTGLTGGMVYSGYLPPGAKPSRYERVPVLPQAGLKDKGLRPGMRATLKMDTIKGSDLVVVAIEQPDELERIGIDFLDAPAPKAGR